MATELRRVYEVEYGEPPPSRRRVALPEVPQCPRSIDGTSVDSDTPTPVARGRRLAWIGALALVGLALAVIGVVAATRPTPTPTVEAIDKASPPEPSEPLAPRVVSSAQPRAPERPSASADPGAGASPPPKPPRWPGIRHKTNPDRPFDHQ